MADWRLLATKLALANGKIVTTKKAQIIREELLADGKIDKSEFEFLIALRRGAQSVDPVFDGLVFKVIKPILLKDGCISPQETAWLKRLLMSDGVIDQRESRFLKDLRASSKTHCKEFIDWCNSLGV